MKLMTVISLLLFLVACDDSSDISESLKAQSELTSTAQIQANNQNLAGQAAAMEQDLAKRHHFYQALKGRFEGRLTTDYGEFKLRVTLTPTLSPFPQSQGRSHRQLDEIINDLNQLGLNITVTQWNPQTPMSAITCTIENVKADLVQGRLTIQSQTCSSQVFLFLSELGTGRAQRAQTAQVLAADLMQQQVDSIDVLAGEVLPNSNAHIYQFEIEKVAP